MLRQTDFEIDDCLADLLPLLFNGQRGWIMSLGGFAYGAFFDESGRLVEKDPLCIAGFTFKDNAYKQFARAWKDLLATGIPGRKLEAMHMYELIGQKKQFKELDLPPRIRCFERAIDIICEHASLVTGAMFDQKEFEEMAGPDWPDRFGSSYAALCQRAAQTTATWMKHKKRFQPILYTFENGHEWEYQTDQIFKGIGRTDHLVGLYQYGHHVFVEKKRNYGVQTADIAAWLSVRIHLGDSAPAKSIQPFMPALLKLVTHFQEGNNAMVRFLTGEVLQSFVDEQKNRPIAEDVPCNVGTAKRQFR